MAATETHRAIDAVWRIEAPRLIPGLARIVRDVRVAEGVARAALVTALNEWANGGIPDNPGAWLMAAAKNRALDALRRKKMLARKHAEITREIEEEPATDQEALEEAVEEALG